MRARLFLLLGLAIAIPSQASFAGPDDAEASVPPSLYGPVTAGTKSYRPVEPLPWGEVNRRVMPKSKQADDGAPAAPPARDGDAAPAPPPPQRKP
jgi:hypothetical protein